MANSLSVRREEIGAGEGRDYTLNLPDECLACVFHGLDSGDRKRCSLVCKRWFKIEGSSRQRLSLNARSDISTAIQGLFQRFHHVTNLALKYDGRRHRRTSGINDEALIQVGIYCTSLRKLKLKACTELSDLGIEEFAKRCRDLTSFSCGSCTFGARGMNAILKYCVGLEELSVKRLSGVAEGNMEAIGPGGCVKLRRICLKHLYRGQYFESLIAGSKNLKSLELSSYPAEWDKLLEVITADNVAGLVEVHFVNVYVTDRCLFAVSRCMGLEVLHLENSVCSNVGIAAIADGCKNLKKLHIAGWNAHPIGDKGLSVVARRCLNLQEVVLIGLNYSVVSLGLLASNCKGLERLTLSHSETIGDEEIACIARKCLNLKKLYIRSCAVSDVGIDALISGCPKLVKLKVESCEGVTCEGVDRLLAERVCVAVKWERPIVRSWERVSVAVSLDRQTPIVRVDRFKAARRCVEMVLLICVLVLAIRWV